MQVLERAQVETLEMSRSTVSHEDMRKVVETRHHDPHSVLGQHPVKVGRYKARAIRVFQPHARSVTALLQGEEGQQEIPLAAWGGGFFEGAWRATGDDPHPYRLRFEYHNGDRFETDDPYRFLPSLGDLDIHLFNEGTHTQVYRYLGSHPRVLDGVQGTAFAVWAPSAERVSVVGDFNGWDGRIHAMRVLGASGVWELFIPQVGEGGLYKFEIRTRDGQVITKSDPYGFQFEMRPGTAARVTSLEGHEWSDASWMEKRARTNWQAQAINIYEVHLGSWMQGSEGPHGFLGYRHLAEKLADYVLEMGYTHIELLPVMEHPLDKSWGYQVTGYYAPTSRFGSPRDFMAFMDHMHQRGIGVILDWVPAHFPRDTWSLGRFDGTACYEHEDPRQGEHRDWGTYIFNYGRNEVRNFLVANAKFWMDYYHADGLRVDAVASMLYLDFSKQEGDWIPNRYGGKENLDAVEFIKYTNTVVHQDHPGVLMVAEESTSWPMVSRPVYLGGLGFDFKWNMGWMNDYLSYVAQDPVHRKFHHNNLTFAMIYAYSENFALVVSHDEVVHGKKSLISKMPGDDWQKFANMRVSLGYMMCHPGKKLLFQGQEFGQWNEWYEAQSIDWHLLEHAPHRQLQDFVRSLNHVYREQPALHQVDSSWQGFDWIDCNDSDNSVISYVRRAADSDDYVICVFNFTPVPRQGYRLGVPREGYYRELLNSDGEMFGGSNVGNYGGVSAEPISAHGRPWSLSLNLPPLSALILQPDRSTWMPAPSEQRPGEAQG